MTGKDVILYILNNNLVDVNFDEKIRQTFLTIEEAALKLGVSVNSIKDMISLGVIDYVTFNEIIYLHKDTILASIQKIKKERL